MHILRSIATIASVAFSLAMINACSDDDKAAPLTPSKRGESCVRTSDCENGLACINNVCGGGGTGGEGGGGGAGGGTPLPDGGVAPMPDGSVTPAPRLSKLRDSCDSTLDCEPGLVCVNVNNNFASGVCDLANFGLTPTGKTCGGECNTPTDCCQLPHGLNLSIPNGGGSVSVHNCQDILQRILSGNAQTACASGSPPAPGSDVGIGCFYYQTYCSPGCTAATWSCTANRCIFAGSCTVNQANQFGGCPSQSRAGTGLVTSCDLIANRCQGQTSGCTSDAQCGDGEPIVDRPSTCRGGDCTCYNKSCYLKCSEDLDCEQGFSCDSSIRLCVRNPGCTTNAQCADRLSNVRAECKDGACRVPCTVDRDCSPSGAIPGASFNGNVCVNGGCQDLGCSTDDDCPGFGSGSVHNFCVTPTPAGTTKVAKSAITN